MSETFETWLEADSVPCGDCFRYAYQFYRSHAGEDVALVHGEVTHPLTGKTFPHAWVVKDGNVYDWQAGGKRSDLKSFRRLWKPKVNKTYLGADMMAVVLAAAKSRHYGPWS